MELIQGGSLRNFYKQRKKEKIKITEEEASLVMKKLLNAVVYLHN
jgi:serine/threonine protein kinase